MRRKFLQRAGEKVRFYAETEKTKPRGKPRSFDGSGESLVEVVDAHGAADLLHRLLADTAGFGGAALPRPAPSCPNGCNQSHRL